MTTIFLINILDDLFTTLVLEVDINIRRLVSLPRYESLEQQLHMLRVDSRNAQAVAHDRVGSRTATLTENTALPGEYHNSMHGEEEVFVAKIADQLQLLC